MVKRRAEALQILAVQAVMVAAAIVFMRPLAYLVWIGSWSTLWKVSNRLRAIAEHGGLIHYCHELGVVDGIVPEPAGGAHTDPDEAARLLAESLKGSLAEVEPLDSDERRRQRRRRFRSMGLYLE